MDTRFVLAEAVKGFRRHASMMAAVIVCVAVSLILIGASALLSRQVDELKGYWYDKVEVSVFLCGTASDTALCPGGTVTDAQRDEIRAALEALPVTEHVYYESQAQAWARFSDSHAGSPVLAQVDESTMPETYRVKLTDPTQFAVVAAQVAGMDGVESVQDQRKLLAQFFTVVGGLQTAALAVAAAQVLIALLLISNTVRAAVTARRREVAVMRLVGASKTMIRGPFLAEAALAGLLGSVLSVGALAALQHFVINAVLVARPGAPSYVSWADLFAVAPFLLLGGCVFPVLAAWVALRRHLRV